MPYIIWFFWISTTEITSTCERMGGAFDNLRCPNIIGEWPFDNKTWIETGGMALGYLLIPLIIKLTS